MDGFTNALGIVLNYEGSEYTNDPSDKGGPTKYGITLATLNRFYNRSDLTSNDVQNLTIASVSPIYRKLYWDAMNLNLINDKYVAALLFEQGVNRGTVTVIKQVQQQLGLQDDGILGSATAYAINYQDHTKFCLEFLHGCISSYIRICVKNPGQLKYLAGWTNRIFNSINNALYS